ncbi:hypothetical protein J4211_02435, partial [Candidatus Woesearchaeota archaeon]|nr:hypothetical protein [Candidatus Woesearchaeota archaeon]
KNLLFDFLPSDTFLILCVWMKSMLTTKEVGTPGPQRCPNCGKQMLSFNTEQNTLRCSNCGYERKMQT